MAGRPLLSFGGIDYPIYRMILNIQEIVLDQCLDSGVLQRSRTRSCRASRAPTP